MPHAWSAICEGPAHSWQRFQICCFHVSKYILGIKMTFPDGEAFGTSQTCSQKDSECKYEIQRMGKHWFGQ